MAITITATKKGHCCGRPAVDIVHDAGTKLEEILDAQRAVFADRKLAERIGFKFCGGCYSGLDLHIRERFEVEVKAVGR